MHVSKLPSCIVPSLQSFKSSLYRNRLQRCPRLVQTREEIDFLPKQPQCHTSIYQLLSSRHTLVRIGCGQKLLDYSGPTCTRPQDDKTCTGVRSTLHVYLRLEEWGDHASQSLNLSFAKLKPFGVSTLSYIMP